MRCVKVTVNRQVVTFMLLFLLCEQSRTVTCELFTTSHNIDQMVDSLDTTLELVKKFIDEERQQLQELADFRELQIPTLYAEVKAEGSRPVSEHPNSAYLAIKRFRRTWAPVLTHYPRLASLLEDKVPSDEDLTGAISSLLRLQAVYGLEAKDMMAGNYLGYQGPPLQPDDPYQLGHVAFHQGLYQVSIDWLEVALEVRRQHEEVTELAETAVLLSRAFLYAKDRNIAVQLYNYSKPIASGLKEAETLRQELEGEVPLETPPDNLIVPAVRRLCSRGKNHTVAKVEPYHVCRRRMAYRRSYWTFREEILSLQPFVSLIYDVISDQEIEAFLSYARKNKLLTALVGGKSLGKYQPAVRSSGVTWIYDWILDQAREVSNRIHAITDLDVEYRYEHVSSAEPFQVVNYGLGGHYYEHMDTLDAIDETGPVQLKEAGNRIATFLLYLSDVEKGGNTVFVNANISVAPVKGMALLWYNYRPDYNEPDKMTKHCGCPVLIGQKWIANKWIWEYGNTFRWPCGQSPSDTQLDIERLLLERDREAAGRSARLS